jgi:hypothetical protein
METPARNLLHQFRPTEILLGGHSPVQATRHYLKVHPGLFVAIEPPQCIMQIELFSDARGRKEKQVEMRKFIQVAGGGVEFADSTRATC